MTAHLTLDPSSSQGGHLPSFVVPALESDKQLSEVVQAILKAKRVVCLAGAGISVEAGIPDFRSSDGLFKSLKRDNPKENLSSGKDLFDAALFNSEQKTSMFFSMIGNLAKLAEHASPTAFHDMLRDLDDKGKLLRVYTQNIDALEEKSGLTFGIPEPPQMKPKPKTKPLTLPVATSCPELTTEPSTSTSTSAESSPAPTGPVLPPRCIPLHGTLQTMHCTACWHTEPLAIHIDSLIDGSSPTCPQCRSLEVTRQMVGKRLRGVGRLRPSVVLYGEDHRHAESVGSLVHRDLCGSSRGKGKGRAGAADLLLVVGTSLRVPGTKRIVREFSKALRPPGEPKALRTVHINFDFPVPTREWEGVFDVWIQGDAQKFARVVQTAMVEAEALKIATPKRKRVTQCETPPTTPAKIPRVNLIVRPSSKSSSHKSSRRSLSAPPSRMKKRSSSKLKSHSSARSTPIPITPSKTHRKVLDYVELPKPLTQRHPPTPLRSLSLKQNTQPPSVQGQDLSTSTIERFLTPFASRSSSGRLLTHAHPRSSPHVKL